MKRQGNALYGLIGLAAIAATSAFAQTNTTLIVLPTSAGVFDSNHVVGVKQDAAPGTPFGSFASDGTAKTDMYFTPEALFGGREVKVGDVARMSYWTKKGSTHLDVPVDWYVNIYTKRYAGQIGTSWYGVRIGTEPYFSANINDPANTWNEWSTEGAENRLRFFESTYGDFGSYADPHWSTYISGTSLAGPRGPGVPLASQPILSFSVQTGSGWAAGFTGQVDGLRIELNDGSVALINFEPFLVPTNAEACKKGGWMSLYRADGTTFKNQGDCIQYVNTSK